MPEKFKYSGELNAPIPKPQIDLLASDAERAEVAKQLTTESYRRMTLLFDVHGVEHGNWEALCFALARAHVAGFKIARSSSGPKTKWDDITRAELVLAVESTGINNVSDATKQLAAQEPWCSIAKHGGAKTLRDEYYRADNKWVQILKKAKAWESLQLAPNSNNS